MPAANATAPRVQAHQSEDNQQGVPVAGGLLYPLFGVLLSPMLAAAAMSFSSVSVVANALRLRRAKM